MRGGTETPRAPALGSRFRENDDGGVGVGECCWWRAGGPARRDGRFANRPYDGVWERRRCDEGWLWGCPAHAPLGTGFRRYDGGGCAGTASAASVGRGSRSAGRALREAPLRCFRGVENARGVVGGLPRPCPSGYRLSPVRRWRVCGSANAAGVGRGSRSGGTGDSRIAPTTGCDARGRGFLPARERRAGEAPFDRLRANGFVRRACGGEEGMRWGGRRRHAPRPGPGFPLSRERR